MHAEVCPLVRSGPRASVIDATRWPPALSLSKGLRTIRDSLGDPVEAKSSELRMIRKNLRGKMLEERFEIREATAKSVAVGGDREHRAATPPDMPKSSSINAPSKELQAKSASSALLNRDAQFRWLRRSLKELEIRRR